RNLFGVRRPDRGIVVRGAVVELELLPLPVSVLRPEVELVLAALVGEIGDPTAVGRPGRVALGGAGAVGDIANIPLLGGDGEDFPAGLEDRAGTAGGQGTFLNQLGD